jgi:hypothetical protein
MTPVVRGTMAVLKVRQEPDWKEDLNETALIYRRLKMSKIIPETNYQDDENYYVFDLTFMGFKGCASFIATSHFDDLVEEWNSEFSQLSEDELQMVYDDLLKIVHMKPTPVDYAIPKVAYIATNNGIPPQLITTLHPSRLDALCDCSNKAFGRAA